MKKTRKRMILLLVAVLLLALLPLSALAEEISDLHLTVPVPAEGMKPDAAAPALYAALQKSPLYVAPTTADECPCQSQKFRTDRIPSKRTGKKG